MEQEESIKQLHNYEAFAEFVAYIYEMRETAIRQMRDKGDSSVMQLSGEAVACDEILRLANWEELRARHFGRN
jgi:hypothetical protein